MSQPWGVKPTVDTSVYSNRELYDDNERMLKGTFVTVWEAFNWTQCGLVEWQYFFKMYYLHVKGQETDIVGLGGVKTTFFEIFNVFGRLRRYRAR